MGGIYFVADGHHRISVASLHRQESGMRRTAHGVLFVTVSRPEAQFYSLLFEGLEDVAGVLFQAFEGLTETIAALIANPRQPQLALTIIVEALRDAITQFLEVAENMTVGFLDVVAAALEELQSRLNDEIDIPFISDLFELIGAGKLTLLNVSTLLLAIPVTIVAKVVFKEHLFHDALPPDFSAPGAASSQGKQLLENASLLTRLSRDDSIRIWGLIGMYANLVNGIINVLLDFVPEGDDTKQQQTGSFGVELMSLVLSGLSWFASFPSSPGFPGGRPYDLPGYDVNEQDNAPEYWERVMWGWRTAVLGVNFLVMAVEYLSKDPHNPTRNLQRLKRRDWVSIPIYSALSAVDLGLTITYLAAVPNEDKPGRESVNEIASIFPNLLCPLRLFGLQSSAALSVVDAFANLAQIVASAAILNNNDD